MRDTATGLAIGTAGGLAFWLLGIPAPWLAGSMMAAIIAVFSRVRVGMPDWLRTMAFIFLGIQTGTAVSWDTVDRAIHWPISIAFLCLTVVAVTWACMAYYIRRHGWDVPTALFASLPGALSLTLLLASSTTADMRRVTIAQCIRLFFLVAALPTVITWLRPPEDPLTMTLSQIGGLWDIVLLVAVSTAAGYALEWLKVPAGLMLGPMLASAALELSGVISGTAPMSILIPANVVLGVMIGARFSHFTFAEFRAALVEGFSGFLIALVIAMAGAGVAAYFSGLPFALTLLAFSPGGLDAMTIMAFSLNLDPAYVGAHQMVRYMALALLMPAATAYVLKRMGAYGGSGA
ncbi:AbrB family transcriptional regulator [Aestuariivirga litoralis]|uniref:AbrB family transcriptional regulator n=1 Tax=Aestuariivirga litoralis TaxID=2650924 RepID=A0A2W2ASZ4_9HYPH|nr:AbrB family transcriptional regulator [Aestuariivirga litoralis]PZF78455.1 AbrB family transcriptional regulator [Aestuariivirga litoralis]